MKLQTFRTRLTVMHAGVVALFLSAVLLVLIRLVFGVYAAHVQERVHAVARAVETFAALFPQSSPADIERFAKSQEQGEAVIAFVLHEGPLRAGASTEKRGKPVPPPNSGLQTNIASLLGLQPTFLDLRNDVHLLVAPDLRALSVQTHALVAAVGIAIAFSCLVGCAVGWWLTGAALAPLVMVTGELRRFAGGDFTQRPIATNEAGEIGALIGAYNGAADQVVAAFNERIRVDEQMRRFVADAGHELRTPLTVVSGYLDVLERGGVDDPAIRARAFATLRAETGRMRALVERLMALARLERSEPSALEALDVSDVARGAIDEVAAARRRPIAFESPVARPIVLADVAELHEAIGNLVDNAVKYGGGSPVSVVVSRETDAVIVRVNDSGPGIPERERGHVFERFFRGERGANIDGSGLGLAIVERAMARCGGAVELERADPGRTTFALRLPAHRERAFSTKSQQSRSLR